MAPAPPGLLILVPARAGSKGVPGKNVKPLGGIPLLAWTARAIRAARVRARALLTTDDPAIADLGRAEGLEAPFLRPPELATDGAEMLPVVLHALDWLERAEGYRPDAVMLLQPTCPFRRPGRLGNALTLLARPGTEGVVGVARLDRSPALLYREDADGFLEPLAPWEGPTLRQAVGPTLTPNGTL